MLPRLEEEECERLALVGLLVEGAAVEVDELCPVEPIPVTADAVLELSSQDTARHGLHEAGQGAQPVIE